MITSLRFYEIFLILLSQIFFTGDLTMPQIKNKNNNKTEIVSITVVYDNNPMLKGLQTDWGFALLVEVGKTKILFDTGDNGNILLSNIAKLSIDIQSIDFVFLYLIALVILPLAYVGFYVMMSSGMGESV